jgi:hypothetical protein
MGREHCLLGGATCRVWYAEALVESCVLHSRRVRLFRGDPFTRIPHPTTADMSACINSTQRIYERAFKTPYPSERETSSTPTTPTDQRYNIRTAKTARNGDSWQTLQCSHNVSQKLRVSVVVASILYMVKSTESQSDCSLFSLLVGRHAVAIQG